ncbi:hypothetical protein [Guggenheimella bovis]
MKEIIISLALLMAFFLIFTYSVATFVGKRVQSKEAKIVFFRRQLYLLPMLSMFLVLYLFLKAKFFPEISLFLEVLLLLVVSLFLASRVELHFAKDPREYKSGDEGLILTSVRNAFRFSEIDKVFVENQSRVAIHCTTAKGSKRVLSVHITDDKRRKQIVSWLKAGMKESKKASSHS